jgi:hypothetical protein
MWRRDCAREPEAADIHPGIAMPTSLRLLLALVIAGATTLGAQDTTPRDTASVIVEDSTEWREGLLAGHQSAEGQSVAGRGALGFLGGVSTGFFLLPATSIISPWTLAAGSGVTVVISAARMGGTAPPAAVVERAANGREAFARGFRQGHTERLRARRRKAALVGGAVGAAAGFGYFVWLVSNIST